MSESVDLRRLLLSWPYDPEQDARIVNGDDGREVLQVRTPLGIEQYEMDGRPDGARPHGMESALEFFQKRLEVAKAAGKDSEFTLTPKQCDELFKEGTLYYLRYVRLFQLQDWARTIRDTERNLRAFDLVRRYAESEEDQMFLEKWRPYILRIHAIAAAMQALENNDYKRALARVVHAIDQITGLEELDDETFKVEYERSLTTLRDLADQIRKKRPLTEVEELELQLRQAIEEQEFEEAAQLRDRIRELKNQKIC